VQLHTELVLMKHSLLQALINSLLYSYLLLYTRAFDIDKNYGGDKNVAKKTIKK
jgi:hypothetical protein